MTLGLLRWLRRRRETAIERQFIRHQSLMLDQFRDTMDASGEPDGLRWDSVHPADEPQFVQPKTDGAFNPLDERCQITVVQPIEVRFAAIEDGGMEDAPGLHTVRAAVALFHHDGRDWAVGRCLFNIDADAVVDRLRTESNETGDR